ncbi:MAG: glycosyltransferase [Dehalococcoidia bacterium]
MSGRGHDGAFDVVVVFELIEHRLWPRRLLPVVATEVGAVPEVVEDGITGYVVPPLDPQAMAEAVLRMLGDPALRERMGRAGRGRAVRRFSVERCAQVHLQAYDHALRRLRVVVHPTAGGERSGDIAGPACGP